jgi:hypothetical protein
MNHSHFRYRAFGPLAVVAISSLGFAAAGCSSKNDDTGAQPADAGACVVDTQVGCADGLVCENVEGGSTGCFAPVVVEGRVVSTASGNAAVANARVVARDASGALVSREVAISAADGAYALTVPSPRKADGTPTVPSFTLRADAAGYATFPSGLRVALPVDGANAVATVDAGRAVIKNASTDVGLDPLAETSGLGSIKGKVVSSKAAGTLVVSGRESSIAAPDGTYEIFNVPTGAANVRGYQAGLQLKAADATVPAGGSATGVDLAEDAAPLAVVTGDVSFVNASASSTSVVLVVKSTFNETLARGEVPRGLRLASVSGKYEFKDVPAGDYVVLAAFENDGLVRDPDTSIGGTSVQSITVGSAAVTVPGFKITGALDVVRPGASGPEEVTGAPTFEWKDDSSEDGYECTVFDTFGVKVWEKLDVARVTGAPTVSVVYAGPALKAGYYQLRAVSWRTKKGTTTERTYIAATEDLKGVFLVK